MNGINLDKQVESNTVFYKKYLKNPIFLSELIVLFDFCQEMIFVFSHMCVYVIVYTFKLFYILYFEFLNSIVYLSGYFCRNKIFFWGKVKYIRDIILA